MANIEDCSFTKVTTATSIIHLLIIDFSINYLIKAIFAKSSTINAIVVIKIDQQISFFSPFTNFHVFNFGILRNCNPITA